MESPAESVLHEASEGLRCRFDLSQPPLSFVRWQGNCSLESPNRKWSLDQLSIDGSLKETCSRVDGGKAEDSFRLLWSGLDD